MRTITLPNIRVSSDLEIRLKLKDGGVAIDWSDLSNIKASIYSDRQRSLAGRCDIEIDEEDNTILVCRYSANKPQYPGVNRVIVSCTYGGETKTYDKPAFTFVRWTDDQAGQSITIDDPDIDVEITVEDVSSSILQEAVEAANSAAERANDAAAAAEHMVDIHQGPEGPAGADGSDGKSAYEIAVEEGFVGTEAEWLASLKGDTGVSADYPITIHNGVDSSATDEALSALQGKLLNNKVSQLEAEVHNLSGVFYGVHATTATLPENITAKGYAFVGAENPYAIWNFDGTDWSDSGSVANGITGEPGVGFASIFTPVPYDGTVIIVLSDNNTITINLNHIHPQYSEKTVETSIPSGGFLPDVVYSLGTLTGNVTFALAAAVTGNVNHYFWMFDTSSAAPTITWPTGITWAAGSDPTVAASSHYEISVLGGIAYYSEV